MQLWPDPIPEPPTTVQPLNPALFNALEKAYGNVRINHAGQLRQEQRTSHNPYSKTRTKVTQFGEEYVINCPQCRDDRHRCHISYVFGTPDPTTGRPIKHAAHCFNENCLSTLANQDHLLQNLAQNGYSPGRPAVPVSATSATPPTPVQQHLPPNLVPLRLLAENHPAKAYLRSRVFDPLAVGLRYELYYGEENQQVEPHFTQRLVIPIYAETTPYDRAALAREPELSLVGWQARSLEHSHGNRSGSPKYLSAAGFRKSECLYGLPEAARLSGPIVLCEGVFDRWKIGPRAVALFGKTLSSTQLRLLLQVAVDRPIVVLLDNDAHNEATAIRDQLLHELRKAGAGQAVVVASVPEGYQDPGDCPTRLLLPHLMQQTKLSFDLPPTNRFAVGSGTRLRTNSAYRERLGTALAVGYVGLPGPPSTASAGELSPAVVVVGRNEVRQYLAQDAKTGLEAIAEGHRLYADLLAARWTEQQQGIAAAAHVNDLKTAARLLDQRVSCDLPTLAKRYLSPNAPLFRPTGSTPTGLNVAKAVGETDLLRQIWGRGRLMERLQRDGLEFVYRKIELPVAEITARMLHVGIGVDRQRVQRRADLAETTCRTALDSLREVAGRQVDPHDTSAVVALLYDQMQLPVLKRTNGGQPSTDDETLQRLIAQYPYAQPTLDAILDFRQAARHQAALDSIRTAIQPHTGRLHCTLDPLGTETGRFSCSSPNLQGLERTLRDVIVAQKGYQLLEADFSQMELRVLAQLAGDRALIDDFHQGIDLHRQTAALVLSKAEEDITPAERRPGKEINFSVIYGGTPQGLASRLGVSVAEAQAWIERFLDAHPDVHRWIEDVHHFVRQHHYVRTLYGRRRWFSSDAANRQVRRQAVNSVVQGTAADVFKLALVRLAQALPESCRLLLPVHDAVLIEVPEPLVANIRPTVKTCFEERPAGFSVPLVVDIGVGRSWADCGKKMP